jgi:hypothetical protein
MNVEVVTNEVPASGLGIGRHDGLDVGQKIVLCTRGSSVRSEQLSGHHIPTENEGTSAVARVLKLAPLHFSKSQRQSWVLALQRLNPGQFIGTHRPLPLPG